MTSEDLPAIKGIQLLRVLLMKPDDDLLVEIRHGAGQPLEHYAHNWGVLLADVIRHVSFAYQRTEGTDPELIRTKVLAHLQEDLDKPDPEHVMSKVRRFDPPGG